MWKRAALLGSFAALTLCNPASSSAAVWRAFAAAAAAAAASSTDTAPVERVQYYYDSVGCCNHAWFPRPCCYRPWVPRPVDCCRPYYPRPCCYNRPLYYYGDNFAPYGYNWYRYDAGYYGYGYGYGYDGF
jgi:hypothetical protein